MKSKVSHRWLAYVTVVFAACSNDTVGSNPAVAVADTAVASDAALETVQDVPPTADSGPSAVDVPGKDALILPSCKQNSDCETGYCVVSSHGKVCTSTCIDGCANGWICAPIPGKDAISLCLDPYGMLCNPCAADNDCQAIATDKGGDRCVAVGGGQRGC